MARVRAALALAGVLLPLGMPAAPALGPADLPLDDVLLGAMPVAHYFGSGWVPSSGEAALLLGHGRAGVTLGGRPFACEGESLLALEASWKPGGLEPSVTLWYGGSHGQGASLLPCAQGQLRQAMGWHLSPRSFAGAWSARYEHETYAWDLRVGAEQPDGTRAVAFRFASVDGLTVHTFEGLAYEWR